MSRVVHFEIHAENPERAVQFYTAVFGWQFKKWDGPSEYWLIMTGDETPGINGGLMRRHGPPPVEGQCVNSFVCTVGVQSLDTTVASVTANGGTIAHPKMPIPTIGWLAYAKDTEGNIFGMMQPDHAAK
jgi:uncharacterized protein